MLLMLHGALGSASQLEALKTILQNDFPAEAINLPGHGGAPGTAEDFSIKAFAQHVLEWMSAQGLERISVFGYSMGGYIGAYLARHYPEKIDKLITLATKLHWDQVTADKEVQMLQPDKIAEKLPAFAKTLEERHAPADWKQVLRHTADMMIRMGQQNPLAPADYPMINCPALVMLGDRDKMVSRSETFAFQEALPQSQLAILPGIPHPFEQADHDLVAFLVRNFLFPR